MANPHNPIQNYARIPFVLGVARCTNGSDAVETSSPTADALGNILTFFCQSAALIGDAFGLEDFNEAHLHSKTTTTICLPRPGESIGLLAAPTTRPADIVAKVATLRGEI